MPLLWFSLAFIFGIIASPHLPISLSTTWFILVVLTGFSLVEKKLFRLHPHPLLSKPIFNIPISLLVFAVMLGVNRFQSAMPESQSNEIFRLAGQSDVTLVGVVRSNPERSTFSTNAAITCEEVFLNDDRIPIDGKISVSLPRGFQIFYGDRVQITGAIESTLSPGELPITSWLGREGIFAEMEFPELQILESNQANPVLATLFRIRERANMLIFDMIPFPESAVFSGILLGIDNAIPEYLWNGYRASGIAHIVVISGFNISIIAILLFRMMNGMLRLKISLPLTLSLVVVYTILVGANTPVVRAAIMATIGLPAIIFGRRSVGIHNLSLAAALMLFMNPFLLWDISFQLSYLATLALLVMTDPIIRWITSRRRMDPDDQQNGKAPILAELVVSTLCASFAVFPILFRLTGTLSLVSIPANILVGPLQPPIMVIGGAALLVGFLSPLIGGMIAKMVWPLVALCNQIALRFSVHPSSLIYLPDWVFGVSLTAVIGTLGFFSWKQIMQFSIPADENALD